MEVSFSARILNRFAIWGCFVLYLNGQSGWSHNPDAARSGKGTGKRGRDCGELALKTH